MTYSEKLKELVHSNKKRISVRDVAHQFNVHVSEAQRILEDFLTEHNGDNKLSSVYVISGTSKDSCESYKSYKLAYAKGDEVEEIKKEFATVDSCSLFSVAEKDVEPLVEDADQNPILDISDISEHQKSTYISNDGIKLCEDSLEKMKSMSGLQKNNKYSIPRSVYLEALKNAPPPRSLTRYKGQHIRLDISETMSHICRQKTSPQTSRSTSNFFSFKASLLNKMYEDKKKRWADEDARKLKYSQEIYDEEELVDLEEDLEISDSSDEEVDEPEQDDLSDLEDANQTEEKKQDANDMVVNRKRRPKIEDDDADEASVDFEDLPTEGEESDSEEKDSPDVELTPVAVVLEKIETSTKTKSHIISDQEEGYDGEIEDDPDDYDDKPIDDGVGVEQGEEENEEENGEENEEENEEEDEENEEENDEDKENRNDDEEENVKTTDFIFNEADVSGSDSSDDEDPDDDIDELIDDEGAEKVDSEKARKEIQKIYHKELLNEDKRMLLQLQERYLEDGDLHSDQKRVKKFRWGTANPVWLDNARYSDSSTDMSDDNDDDDDDDRPVFKLKSIVLPSTSTENNVQESTQKAQPILATSNFQSLNKPSGLITSYLVRDKQLNNILSTKRRNPFNKDRMEFKRIKSGPQKCKTLFELYSRN